MEKLEDIWAGDLFSRQQEAEDVMGYLQSVAGRPSIREDGHAHVLAVDSGYGQGKTFFLRRLARHMKHHDHAVAFVDAWVDDLEDEPMVALAATLEEALDPYIKANLAVADRFGEFRSKAGQVAKIVGLGALKRGVGLLITQAAAELAAAEIAKGSDVVKDIYKDALKSSGTGAVDDAIKGFAASPQSMMAERIATFREGQQAIRDMKAALGAVVAALVEAGMKLPVTIIVDELDRCRPTYAIKALEEIKHLFDVPGVAFVLGLHGEQLAHSIGAAYGQNFDGAAYLRRFSNRQYRLKPAALEPLIEKLLIDLRIDQTRLVYPLIKIDNGRRGGTSTSQMISLILQCYSVKPRDAFRIMDVLQTSVALLKGQRLMMPYLLSLIISDIFSKDHNIILPAETNWRVIVADEDDVGHPVLLEFSKYISDVHSAARLTDRALRDLINEDDASFVAQQVGDFCFELTDDAAYGKPRNYRRLLQTVARFIDPTAPQTSA